MQKRKWHLLKLKSAIFRSYYYSDWTFFNIDLVIYCPRLDIYNLIKIMKSHLIIRLMIRFLTRSKFNMFSYPVLIPTSLSGLPPLLYLLLQVLILSISCNGKLPSQSRSCSLRTKALNYNAPQDY